VPGVVLALSLFLALAPLELAIVALGGVALGLMSLIWPKVGLYVLIPAIPFSGLLKINLGGVNVGPMEGLLVLMLGAWLLKMAAQQKIILPQPPLLWPFLIFLTAIGLSWVNTFSLAGSLIETAKWVEMLALYLFITATCTRRDMPYLLALILLTGLIQAAIGLYQFVFKVGPAGFLLFDGAFLRAYGTFQQPNPYAGYLGLVLPLALSLTLWQVERLRQQFAWATLWQAFWRGEYVRPVLLTLATGGIFVALLAGLYASQSRGGLIAFATGAGATLFALGGYWIALLVLGATIGGVALAIGGLSLLPATLTQRFEGAIPYLGLTDVAAVPVTDANFSTIERLAHWQAAREMWLDHFWFGVGFGNYERIYSAYAVGRWQDALGHAHNYILNLGAEVGYIGLLAYLIFWGWGLFILLMSLKRSQAHSQNRAVLAGSLGILAHLHTHNLLDNLYVQGMYLHIAIILGLMTLAGQAADHSTGQLNEESNDKHHRYAYESTKST
jgi:O-antigen ligase